MFLINVTEYYERKFHIKYIFFLTIIKICSFKIFSMKFCNKCNHAELNLKNGRKWINYASEKKIRYKIRRTWKPSSIHNRSIQRKFAEIFDLIFDRLLMYYEWNILHELKLDSISLKCRNFFSLSGQKNLWSFEMASIKFEQFWILNVHSVRKIFILLYVFW